MSFRLSAILAVGLGVACTHFADTAELRLAVDAGVAGNTGVADASPGETSGPDTERPGETASESSIARDDAAVDGAECVDPELDGDGDGHAARTSGKACADDCNDDDPEVFPGQAKWFTFATDVSEFDWDCSGVAEKRFVARAKCEPSAGGCAFSEGWVDSVPGCGVTADWLKACTKLASGACGASASAIERRVQECH